MTKKLGLLAGILVCGVLGCASKLVWIDSKPGLADIYINSQYVGKTPLYHRFKQQWYPWPYERTADYTVTAKFEPGYLPEEKFFGSASAWPDINYVPDEIIFELRPAVPGTGSDNGARRVPPEPVHPGGAH